MLTISPYFYTLESPYFWFQKVGRSVIYTVVCKEIECFDAVHWAAVRASNYIKLIPEIPEINNPRD